MAIAPTGAIYKALTFDGTSSRTFGVYITGAAVYNAPERAVEMISIPGRNGAFALDSGRFENLEVKYPAGVFADNEADFAQAVSDFRNFLCSKKGYVRLTDEYNPNEYRMAVYKSGLEVTPAQLRAGEFNLVFECKPQRWLTSGEEISEIGVWGDTETGTGSIVEIDNPDDMLAVKDLTVNIEPMQSGSGDPSPNNIRPITGHTGANVYRTGKNLFGSIVIEKLNNNGTTTASTSDWHGQRVNVGTERNLTLKIYENTTYTSGSIGVAEYASNGTYITGGNFVTTNSISSYPYTTSRTLNANTAYFILRGYHSGGASGITSIKAQVEFGTTATAYEAYNGDTYSITFTGAGTVYGGTLDVTTGVLTVDRAVVPFSDITWSNGGMGTNGHYFYATTTVPFLGWASGGYASAMSNMFVKASENAASSNAPNGSFWWNNASTGYRLIYGDENTSTTDISNLNAVLSGKLTTPTTHNLTAEEVTLLLGQNNIWADTGDTTVEYGDAPNQLFNPTLFDAHPLLAVEGYGNIYINDSLVTLKNITYGETIAGPMSSTELTGNIVFVDSHINAGDDIWLSSAQVTQTASLKSGYTHRDSSVTSVTNNGTATISDSGRRRTLSATEINFKYGTASTETYLATYYLYWKTSVNSYTGSATLELSLAYDGDHTIAYTITYAVGTPYNSTSVQIQTQNMRADSTASALGHPAYIDLDIGVAWNEDSGTPTSMNSAVELPAELPVLVPGANSITFDNTITDLQITPRWWKV